MLDLLTSLIDKSLVVVEQSDARFRYRLLETVRQYARERLVEGGGAEAIRERHRDYFVALAEEADNEAARCRASGRAADASKTEHDNLRSALEWSHVAAPAQEDLRLCGAMHRFWFTRGYLAEGREWCARILAKGAPAAPTPEYARAVNAAGSLAWHQTDFAAARPLLEQGLAISRGLGDRLGLARSLNNLGSLAFEQGDYPAAQTLYEESLAVWRELGDGAARPACSAISRWWPGSVATWSPPGPWRKSR